MVKKPPPPHEVLKKFLPNKKKSDSRYDFEREVEELKEPAKEFINRIATQRDAPAIREVQIPVQEDFDMNPDNPWGEYYPPPSSAPFEPFEMPVGTIIIPYPSAFMNPTVITHETAHHISKTSEDSTYRDDFGTEKDREMRVIQWSWNLFCQHQPDFHKLIYPTFKELWGEKIYPHPYR